MDAGGQVCVRGTRLIDGNKGEGPSAKSLEVKYSKLDRQDLDKIFALLEKSFWDPVTKTQAYDAFRGRCQKEKESLQDFSIALMSPLDVATKKGQHCESNQDRVLRDNLRQRLGTDI